MFLSFRFQSIFLFLESSEEVGLCKQERRLPIPLEVALLDEAEALSDAGVVLQLVKHEREPEVMVEAV